MDSVVAQRVSVGRDAPGRRSPAIRRGGHGGPDPGVARGRRRRLLRGPPRPPPTARRPPPPSTSRLIALARPRYGFVTDFLPGRDDGDEVADSLRAFHLNAVQFYDWMYRHARLLPPSDDFVDALDRSLSLTTVRRLVDATHAAGAQAIAYAAVYGAGREYADEHPDEVLHHRDGRPWMLGDFLWIMDVSRGSTWSRHVVAQMGEAVAAGRLRRAAPRPVRRPEGRGDWRRGRSSTSRRGSWRLIEAVRAELPDATLIFNNVNDFPTATTARAPQDVTYIEVWSPHDDYADLVRLVDAARDRRPERPVVLAAYLAPVRGRLRAGPGRRREARAGDGLVRRRPVPALRRAPRRPDPPVLPELRDPGRRRGRGAPPVRGLRGGQRRPAVRTRPSTRCDAAPVAGRQRGRRRGRGAGLPRAHVRTPSGCGSATSGTRLVVTLVDLRSQEDPRWNVAKRPTGTAAGLRIRVRVASAEPSARFGHPMAGPELGHPRRDRRRRVSRDRGARVRHLGARPRRPLRHRQTRRSSSPVSTS